MQSGRAASTSVRKLSWWVAAGVKSRGRKAAAVGAKGPPPVSVAVAAAEAALSASGGGGASLPHAAAFPSSLFPTSGASPPFSPLPPLPSRPAAASSFSSRSPSPALPPLLLPHRCLLPIPTATLSSFPDPAYSSSPSPVWPLRSMATAISVDIAAPPTSWKHEGEAGLLWQRRLVQAQGVMNLSCPAPSSSLTPHYST
ncbi:hypothetical protein E2562_039236 [Oryza meyeriana var. granulata]|uniref:Uncharacterized protein n=1 Tax=Oryza meyeriana var. granulata TaxID=110450 RepID=A0A6G1CMG5_9ORYZ|nr:hypothetical protein E2562_039236 [Oryza meyeriana var. granulata]